VLVAEALLKAVLDGRKDGLRCRALRRVAARSGVVRGVGRAAGAVYLQEDDRVKEAPGRLEVAPPLKRVAAQVRWLTAQAGDDEEPGG